MSVATIVEPEVRDYTASDGYVFKYRHWRPAGTPRGYIVALHGIQSHPGWYDHSTRRLCEAGYDIRYLDRRGAGLNEVDRGHGMPAERLIADVTQVLRDVRYERERVAEVSTEHRPIVLTAVSWGGKLATAVCGSRPDLVDGLALLYPGIKPLIRPTWVQDFKLRAAMFKGWSKARVPIPLDDPTLFTDTPEWQRFIADDPLALHKASVGFLAASRGLDQINGRIAHRITMPTLLMLAGRDRIIDNAATKAYFARLGSSDRTLVEYPEAAHTLEFEPNRDEFVDALLDWLEHLANGS